MKTPYRHLIQLKSSAITLMVLPLLLLLPYSWSAAAPSDEAVIEIKLGDYRFMPAEIQLAAGRPAVLRLTNIDSIVPHNFTLSTPGQAPDIDVDILGGETVEVRLPALPAGTYPFHCNKKMIFMKSHREKGMKGSLIVTAD